jgi:anti-anti-sigma factor
VVHGRSRRVEPVESETAPLEFRVDVEPERERVRICPVGELDLATVDEVRAHMEDVKRAGFRRVVLDLRGTTFMDSTGIRLVLEADASARDDGWEFALVAGRGEVQRVLEIAGVVHGVSFVEP